MIGEHLDQHKARHWLRIDPAGGRLRAMLYEWGAVADDSVDSEGRWLLEVTLADERWRALCHEIGFKAHVDELDQAPISPPDTPQLQPEAGI